MCIPMKFSIRNRVRISRTTDNIAKWNLREAVIG